jgi:hypothetical protein
MAPFGAFLAAQHPEHSCDNGNNYQQNQKCCHGISFLDAPPEGPENGARHPLSDAGGFYEIRPRAALPYTAPGCRITRLDIARMAGYGCLTDY